MLPDDIFLFFYSSTRVGLQLGGLQRKQGKKKVFTTLRL
jgi:hypothetical protein